MAFHAFSMEDTSCEQAWGQAAPAQPQLPHCLHGEEEDNLSLAFIPNLCCHLERLGKGSEEGLVQQGTGFGAVLGWCSPPGFSWVSILLKRCQWRSFSPLCDPQSLGCISTAASAHGLPCCAPWQPDPQHQALLEQQWVPCASVPVPIQPAPALPTCFCHKTWKHKYFS